MYTSVISLKMVPGSKDDVMSISNGMTDELRDLNCQKFRIVEHEPDTYTVFVLYESKAIWQAAGGKAAELLARLAPFAAETPVRKGGEIVVSVDF